MPRWGAVGVGTSPILTDFLIRKEENEKYSDHFVG